MRASIRYSQKQFELALKDWSSALELERSDSVALGGRGDCYYSIGNVSAAIDDYRAAVEADARNSKSCNSLAWILATTTTDSLRNGTDAVKYARQACKLTNWKQWQYLDTLAAAYAETEDFETAEKLQKQVLTLVKNEIAESLSKVENRLTLYQEKRRFRESPKVPSN